MLPIIPLITGIGNLVRSLRNVKRIRREIARLRVQAQAARRAITALRADARQVGADLSMAQTLAQEADLVFDRARSIGEELRANSSPEAIRLAKEALANLRFTATFLEIDPLFQTPELAEEENSRLAQCIDDLANAFSAVTTSADDNPTALRVRVAEISRLANKIAIVRNRLFLRLANELAA